MVDVANQCGRLILRAQMTSQNPRRLFQLPIALVIFLGVAWGLGALEDVVSPADHGSLDFGFSIRRNSN